MWKEVAPILIEPLGGGIYVATCADQRSLAHTFMRLQELYESPNDTFRTKRFSRKRYQNWYRRTYGRFTYYRDWCGFNIPGYIINRFKEFRFKNVTANEAAILHYFDGMDLNNVYLIGVVSKRDLATLRHELAHAFFHLNSVYRDQVTDWLRTTLTVEEQTAIASHLKGMGYDKSVWVDEMHAYILADQDTLQRAGIKLPPHIQNGLESLFMQLQQELDSEVIRA